MSIITFVKRRVHEADWTVESVFKARVVLQIETN